LGLPVSQGSAKSSGQQLRKKAQIYQLYRRAIASRGVNSGFDFGGAKKLGLDDSLVLRRHFVTSN
jgi:hypothetical protein